ncbi:hypothetical protein HPULCUR_005764 [Helicostylum pulchrum]|uniref:MHYT domain-containing protein n=1 Tax=Helicostylum pulchrum TaxID=562976 RepID=A0ABP9Y000_9FUNG
MGGVGIWSMHFIGNNSLTITIKGGDKHQLSYATGFTFVSLIVAILTMFLAFAFVGITEEAKIARIIPSGIIAGFGIVSMHYLGQVAIDFFVMRNKLPIVAAAAVIAVCAVTAALFIFFKLREQWANQWYKRLGCAMLMGVAVCGMHYTALVGTVYYTPDDIAGGPPTPLLGTGALIGIIAAIVVVACIILFVIGTKNSIENHSMLFQKEIPHKRLILDTIFFDTHGRMLVKVDGIVPMKEILNEIPEDETHEAFSTSHPLFTRLFDTTMQWSKQSSEGSSESVNRVTYNAQNGGYYDAVDDAFLTAANQLVEELRFSKLSDLGHLFDSILCTNTISKKSMFSQGSKKKPPLRRTSSTSSYLMSTHRLSKKESISDVNGIELPMTQTKTKKKSKDRSSKDRSSKDRFSKSSSTTLPEDATVIDIFNNPVSHSFANNPSLTIRDSDTEDRHIFLVKKIESNKDLVNLLSIGFRFAEPIFISKTMGERLHVPSDYLLNYFKDMLQMTETVTTLYTPLKPPGHAYYTAAQQKKIKSNDVRSAVFVGLFILIEDEETGDMPYIIIEKQKRYRFPMVQLTLDGDTESEKNPTELSRLEKSIVLALSGQSLSSITSVFKNSQKSNHDSTGYSTGQSSGSGSTLLNSKATYSLTDDEEDTNHIYNYVPHSTSSLIRHTEAESDRFIKALENAAKSLVGMSSYGKPLATSAKLCSDVIDIPAFSLRPGPCQLILFKSHITRPGTRFAINSTFTESIKCVPFPIYRTFAYHVTDLGVEKYRNETNRHKTPNTYLTQQRLYQNTAIRNKHLLDDDTNIPSDTKNKESQEIHDEDRNNEFIPAPEGEISPLESTTQLQPVSSLPPPPRAKRTRTTFPTGFPSLDTNYFSKDFLPNIMKNTNPTSPNSNDADTEMPIILNLLPPNGRFWWLNNIFEETHNI